ncbi:hypothetical protein [Nannocystis radixulma]|uniref:Methylase-associated X1 domain-containing protein n=1 Tax=Nannocystis radixulma TaxID=2995305 RepID=A0ABT5BQI2_9BACT|nr:hypothetical protein [Nannocystis radixulma]MDC0675978.1 hypothetical protein [Nannocystis radixulma]
MTAITEELHRSFLRPLHASVTYHDPLATKPLCVDFALPLPPRVRLYMYTLVGGMGTKRSFEYKVSLRLPGQRPGEIRSFDYSLGRYVLLVGYAQDLDVFVFWDASLRQGFKNGDNVQVSVSTVLAAASSGRAEQLRSLTTGEDEIVIACQSWTLAQALEDRVAWTGGAPEERWETFRS